MSERVKIKVEHNVLRLPAIALRGLVVFPGSVIHFEVGREKSIAAISAIAATRLTGFFIDVPPFCSFEGCMFVVTGAPPTPRPDAPPPFAQKAQESRKNIQNRSQEKTYKRSCIHICILI